MNSIDIGTKLRKLRGNKSMEEVADAIGICRAALNMYELGKRIPRDETKIRLASYFGTTVEDIFYQK